MTVEDWETRNILEDLQRRHTPDPWDTFANRLEVTLRNYADRRTIQAHMIRDVAELAYGYVDEQLAAPQAERDAQVQRLVGVIERLERRTEIYQTRTKQLERALSEKRTIREEREAARQDAETDVTISNGYGGWTVAGLEEIAYRLRSGGAVDDTPVEIDKSRAVASVPAPNMVTLTAPTTAQLAADEPENGQPLVEWWQRPPALLAWSVFIGFTFATVLWVCGVLG